MKITKVVTRVLYSIELSYEDVKEVFDTYKQSVELQDKYPKAFDIFLDFPCKDCLKLLWRCKADTFTVISQYYKFDGWENAGYYEKDCDRHLMIVYHEKLD